MLKVLWYQPINTPVFPDVFNPPPGFVAQVPALFAPPRPVFQDNAQAANFTLGAIPSWGWTFLNPQAGQAPRPVFVDQAMPSAPPAGAAPITGTCAIAFSVCGLSGTGNVVNPAPVTTSGGSPAGAAWGTWIRREDVREWKQTTSLQDWFGGKAEVSIPAPAIQATGHVRLPAVRPPKKRPKPKPITGSVSVAFPAPTIKAQATYRQAQKRGTAIVEFPAPQLSAQASVVYSARARFCVEVPAVSATGCVALIGVARVQAKAPCLSAQARVYPLSQAYAEDEALWSQEGDFDELIGGV